MVAKFLLLQFALFVQDLVKTAQNDFHRSRATAQIFLLAFLVLDKKF
ncbi:MAG: hypothetical protein WC610_02115 [Patescibacteria group bacterium]